LRPISLNLRKN